ncbi:MAG: GNAT family N-acetyltransferase [Microcella pacifica]|mgnify:CR=1 FL=1|uniref:GNAT family N-acetyltransferase n=1 Tax=Microcella pacifica TaxID=2591847 RepID=A0A9E5JPK7_9MICO|nr:GNAT family N-acetyltransferase [Microcella pacifica]NHF63459.1 GNAT family N-acetyltransferase [Microcella pacifica]
MTATAVTIRPAAAHEHEPAARLLADAFAHDPLVRAATARASAPNAARAAIFRTSLSTTLDQGGTVLVAVDEGTLLGAAIILDPSRGRLRTLAGRVRAGGRFLRMLPLLGRRGLTLLNDADRASRRHAPGDPHHVLTAVGVTAAARGRGIGRSLVEATVDRAREQGNSWGVRLETENSENVDHYRRWGFDLAASVAVRPVTVHVMVHPVREAGSA